MKKIMHYGIVAGTISLCFMAYAASAKIGANPTICPNTKMMGYPFSITSISTKNFPVKVTIEPGMENTFYPAIPSPLTGPYYGEFCPDNSRSTAEIVLTNLNNVSCRATLYVDAMGHAIPGNIGVDPGASGRLICQGGVGNLLLVASSG